MSITIQQSPTTPNMANNTLVYAVTSNTSSAAQYQFVCDITYTDSYYLDYCAYPSLAQNG